MGRMLAAGSGVTALLLCALLAAGAAENTGPEETRATMGRIVEALATVLPLSLGSKPFDAPEQRETVLAALRELAANGAKLASHSGRQDAGFDFLSHSLARDSQEILERFEAGRSDEARFLLHQVTDNCVACHSRLPDDRTHPLGRRLFESEAVSALPLVERAELATATRQFGQALADQEALMLSPDTAPADLDLTGTLDAYLEICLRVEQDPGRAAAGLTRFAARDDVKAPLRENLEIWIASLRELERRPKAPATLAEARALLDRAEDRSRFPRDRQALVYFVAASGVLNRVLASGVESPAQLGEAYYRLGVIESHVGRSFWLSQTEDYLEASIRTDPSGPYAERAYALLEEFIASGYTGTAGTAVPKDVQERLDALGALIAASREP